MDSIAYVIDEQDRLVRVNDAWTRFAADNSGEMLRPAMILGRPLWNFISEPVVRDIYRRLVAQARAGTPTRFAYRCDSPTMRRRFEMRISGVGHQVEFTSNLLSEEARPSIPLFDVTKQHTQVIVRMCGWCHAIARPDGTWEPLEIGINRLGLLEGQPSPRVSHGICAACAQEMFPGLQPVSS